MKHYRWLLVTVLMILTMGCIGGVGDIGVEYALTVEKQGQGTVEPRDGIYKFDEPKILTLKAIPADGWVFVRWEGDVVESTGNETTIAVDRQTVVEAVFAQKSKLAGRAIVVDPGHGGRDPGAVGPSGYQEKDFALSVALQLESLLDSTDATVVMTRREDEFVSLAQRANMSNDAQADFFLSIHANGHSSTTAAGTETFHDGSWRAEQFALGIQRDMLDILGTRHRRVEKWDGLYVLGKTNAPAVLIEPGFLTNSAEEALLRDIGIQEELAEALYNNILKQFD